jgi:hypothetical protein
MKTTTQLVNHLSVLLLLSVVTAQATTPEAQPHNHPAGQEQPGPIQADYTDVVALMKDFTDTQKKADKPITYWAQQLYILLDKDPKLAEFRRKIIPTARIHDPVKRTKGIKDLFLQFQSKFSPAMKDLILQNFAKVKLAVEKRAAKAE